MLIKLIIITLLVAVVVSMAIALIRLVRDGGKSDHTARALTVRIALSIGIFVIIMIGYALGLIEPRSPF